MLNKTKGLAVVIAFFALVILGASLASFYLYQYSLGYTLQIALFIGAALFLGLAILTVTQHFPGARKAGETALFDGKLESKRAVILLSVVLFGFLAFTYIQPDSAFPGGTKSEALAITTAVSLAMAGIAFIALFGGLGQKFLSVSEKGVTLAGNLKCKYRNSPVPLTSTPYFHNGQAIVPLEKIRNVDLMDNLESADEATDIAVNTSDGYRIALSNLPRGQFVFRTGFKAAGIRVTEEAEIKTAVR